MQLVAPVSLLPPILGTIEAWYALDDDARPVTVVRNPPDVHPMYVEALNEDLRAIASTERRDDELALLEARPSVDAPVGVFGPLHGWVLRDLVPSTRVERELAAALALANYRTYSGGPNVLTRDGNLVRVTLPFFEHIWDAQQPSFIGNEPEISEEGRLAELWRFYVRLGGDPADVERGDRATLDALEHPDPGPALIRALNIE